MKLLIFLAVLTLARGADLDRSDEILKELESLVASDQTTKNDKKKLEVEADDKFEKELLTEILSEADDEPVQSKEDDNLPSEDADLMDDIITYTLERRGLSKYGKDDKCHDRLRSCRRRRAQGQCETRKRLLKRLCSLTCGFCNPKNCKDSRYGCCSFTKVAADGPEDRGCPLKLCYDRQNCNRSLCRYKSDYEKKEFCPKTCGLCRPKQPAPVRCEDRGYGCCLRKPSESASGPKRGCGIDKKYRQIFGNRKASPPTCKDRGYGCCHYIGSIAATGSKEGCVPCFDLSFRLCYRFRGTSYHRACLDPHSSHRKTAGSFRIICPRLCGLCNGS